MPEMSRIVAALFMELFVEISKLFHQTGLSCNASTKNLGYSKSKSRSMLLEN
jgi:hypothetical protein